MVRINKNILKEKDLSNLLAQFDIFLARLNRSDTALFLNEILGNEERLILAKRLGAIILLHHGCSEYKTAKLLKLSPTTTGKISVGIKKGSYKHMLKFLQKNKRDYLALLDAIDSMLHLNGLLPHRTGLDRYKHIRQPR